jgi:hypothetical protein
MEKLPNPQIATVEPGSTPAVFKAAPYPVEIPHPKRQTFPRGATAFTYTRNEIKICTTRCHKKLNNIPWQPKSLRRRYIQKR